MALNQNQNRDIAENLIKTLRLNPLHDNIPSTVVPSIQPMIEVDKPIQNILLSTVANETMLTTSTTRDTYLTAIYISYFTLAGTGGTTTVLTLTPNGQTAKAITLAGGSSATSDTAGNTVIPFAGKGLLLGRGTTVVSSGTADSQSFAIVGYVADSTPFP